MCRRVDRFTVEVRRGTPTNYEHFVVEREDGSDADPTEVIGWSDYRVLVCQNEVLDRREASRCAALCLRLSHPASILRRE